MPHRTEILGHSLELLRTNSHDLLDRLAKGTEIKPPDIDPIIVPVRTGTENAIVFRLASLWWSIPVSQGYGRRQRFIVFDRQNDKIIGIFALGDPVFNLNARDGILGWTSKDRELRLRYVIDAFVLGALPPYSALLGGKLIAALLTSKEVEKLFCAKYSGRKTVIRNRRENGRLALLTTSTVFGESSVLDRLQVNNFIKFLYVGKSRGYGHFHVPGDVYSAMIKLLIRRRHPYARGNRFGMGPNWKMRVIRVALTKLGLDPQKLNHGLQRGVYLAPLARNYDKFLRGEERVLSKDVQDGIEAITQRIKNRWIIPRSMRNETWKEADGATIFRYAINSTLAREFF